MHSLVELVSAQMSNYSRYQPKKLYDIAMDAMGDLVGTTVSNLSTKMIEEQWIDNLKEFVEEEIFPVNDYLYNDLPLTCVEELQNTVCDRVEKIQNDMINNLDEMIEYNSGIIRFPSEIMLYLSFHPRITNLCITYFPPELFIGLRRIWLGDLINENLNKMFSLRYFSSYKIYSSLIPSPSLLSNCLVNFEKLEVFEYCSATDELIWELVNCCPKLKVVNVNGSKNVTDIGAEYLHDLPNLQHVEMDSTKVTLDAYTRLMLKMRIAKPSYSYCLNAVISNIKESERNVYMKSMVFSKFLSSDDLGKVVRSFPNLTALSLNYENRVSLPPGDLFELQKYSLDLLILNNCMEWDHEKGFVLKTVTQLHLLNVRLINVKEMETINYIFPNLEELVIFQDPYAVHKEDVLPSFEVLFPNLKMFHSENSVSKNLVTSVLSNCKDIRQITLVKPNNNLLDEMWFEYILRRNPMYDLEIFQADTHTLTMKCVHLLFRRCKKLQDIRMVFYNREYRDQFISFMKAMRAGNFNLEITNYIPAYQCPI